jgi:nucleotide-binding universal stress UspA family protein
MFLIFIEQITINMKKILVATDFSLPAENAARYALHLATALGAEVVFGHVIKAPEGMPLNSQLAEEAQFTMSLLVEKVEGDALAATGKCAKISFDLGAGEVVEEITKMVKTNKIDLVVMGVAGAGRLMDWVLGSNSQAMIDRADFPVLYIPFGARVNKIGKIAFASSLAQDELEPLQFLCRLAAPIGAEISVRHVVDEDQKKREEQMQIDNTYFEQVSSRLDYGKLIFEQQRYENVRDGVRAIRDDQEVDLIAMLHRQHDWVELLFKGSLSHQLSRLVQVPLLIFQPCEKIYYL